MFQTNHALLARLQAEFAPRRLIPKLLQAFRKQRSDDKRDGFCENYGKATPVGGFKLAPVVDLTDYSQHYGCRALKPDEIVRAWDYVEDLETGQLELVVPGMYYAFLQGESAKSACDLPAVCNIIRDVLIELQ